jgi:hypothetical protein
VISRSSEIFFRNNLIWVSKNAEIDADLKSVEKVAGKVTVHFPNFEAKRARNALKKWKTFYD